MNNTNLILIIICVLGVIAGCSSQTGQLSSSTQKQKAQVNFDDHIDISNNILQHAPSPHAKEFNYQQINAASEQPNAYQIHLTLTKDKITHYTVIHDINSQSNVSKIIGYGGILTLSQNEQGNLNSSNKFYRDGFLASVYNIKGKLFPMKVGNKLQFDYSEIITNKANGQQHTQQSNGHITYRIVGHNNGYHYKNLVVPGKIYIIKRSRSIDNMPAMTDNVYYYSPYLGWYVKVEHFTNGQPGPIYNLTSFKTSLELMKT